MICQVEATAETLLELIKLSRDAPSERWPLPADAQALVLEVLTQKLDPKIGGRRDNRHLKGLPSGRPENQAWTVFCFAGMFLPPKFELPAPTCQNDLGLAALDLEANGFKDCQTPGQVWQHPVKFILTIRFVTQKQIVRKQCGAIAHQEGPA